MDRLNDILAGIVTYNPCIDRLKENIEAVLPQVKGIVIVDNGSTNIIDVEACVRFYPIVTLIKNTYNCGIATALNQIFRFGRNQESEWLLTLDQDSVVQPDIVEVYKLHLKLNKAASFTTLRQERSFSPCQRYSSEPFQLVRKCITSGNLVQISAWEAIGGFNEKLFIDMVDTEFCYRLIMAGYNIYQINTVGITHELGNAYQVKFMGRKRTILNHTAFRKYYIYRNTVYLLRHFTMAKEEYSYRGLLKAFMAIILFEEDKWNRITASIRGIRDGLKFR